MKSKQVSFTLESLGCSKNQVDAEIMIASLEAAGLRYVPDPEQAAIIIVNTCAFIQSAKEQSIDTALQLKAQYPEKALIVTGCLSQRYSLEKDLGELDGFLTSLEPRDILPLLDNLLAQGKIPGMDAASLTSVAGLSRETTICEKAASLQPAGYRTRFLSFPRTVYIKVAEGCNNHCTYCAIPLIKGALRSRTIDDVVSEIRLYLEQGIFEFNLVAQDLGSYGLDQVQDLGAVQAGQVHSRLCALLEKISRLEGHFWIRLLYIHPDRFPWPLLDIMQKDKRILPYFDLPFQHAAPAVLKAMGRKGNSTQYLELIAGIRAQLPDAVIRSTFLVGFPAETEEHFKELLAFQEQAKLDWVGSFTYSCEEGTAAAGLADQVPARVARQRQKQLARRQERITQERLTRFVGQERLALIEEAVEGEDLFLGRAYLQAPEVDGCLVINTRETRPGSLLPVRITRCNGFDLEAHPLDPATHLSLTHLFY